MLLMCRLTPFVVVFMVHIWMQTEAAGAGDLAAPRPFGPLDLSLRQEKSGSAYAPALPQPPLGDPIRYSDTVIMTSNGTKVMPCR